MSGKEYWPAMVKRDGDPELVQQLPLDELLARAEAMTLATYGPVVTYSRKVFIPLTRLCRDVCHYCTFATTPSQVAAPYLDREAVLEIARAGVATGCREALFTLGDQPEARYPAARAALERSGHASTLAYLRDMAAAVLDETGLLPHLNPGLMAAADYAALRPVSASMGIMLESASERLCAPGGPHFGSPDKAPAARLASIAAAGAAQVPFTTGLLIGIGETRAERIEALVAIRDLHRTYGHIQEVIIQNFRAKPGTKMAGLTEPDIDEHCWTIAAARLVLGGEMTIQAPPNLHRPDDLAKLLRAGVNDWGGVSPVTPDHVNPEAPWPHLAALEAATHAAGRTLRQRLAIGPYHALDVERWADPAIAPRIRRAIDSKGLARADNWCAGRGDAVPAIGGGPGREAVRELLAKAGAGERLNEDDLVTLFRSEGDDIAEIADFADRLRRDAVGDAVTYVVNRNINYTNICLYRCGFCAFSKGGTRDLRGPAYQLDRDEIGRRAAEAVARGATEVCLQGGIHPKYDGNTYLGVLAAVRTAAPDIHIHAFSPLEVTHGAQTLGLPLAEYLARLKDAGLSSLPGTAAEILDDEVRAILCPDKVTTDEWLDVARTAHRVGLRTTATIMFGHVDGYRHWARHLLRIRDLQAETGGFTEFVPLPFVHMEAPIWRKGKARSGPTYAEAMLMHAIARIALHPLIPNIQVSWVKMGRDGAAAMLNAGANDLGGVLMDESITRAAGGVNGQGLGVVDMQALAAGIGRRLRQRTTLYGTVAPHIERERVFA
ncbi:5-amino-6-(D-ribitylamino)uracil--L-tyrosine 4-hydroxyphenyl transferase CofH [Sphingomonas sp. AOB5]|uniref:5-amino-6-(D-ribitylamino)uracil--L-tyrosine 4-hydroxyphenyl transferase CofH n=1 Tax=Sphingomonas sp. AOB5 TaxID=3034017 RepID=UPI0023FA0231|nr:5-amino-6-(D-ribitylamino)uracil--L-tyrosine 4-hydroxyphenyl transferase CofH [Sphingomonas sp. AOB5]MDF7774869.1 5-amino-6-(D-ribitylamino)uracil--L-tyrosine 4-hydroxyphenyl transferase CofH [Sphingomonas sp. AOB5]